MINKYVLEKMIDNGKENVFIDFKQEFHFDGKPEKAEFVKDCIGFLNADCKGNKYLVFGIKDCGSIIGVEGAIEEEKIQDCINAWIEPTPIVNIEVNYQFKDCKLLVVEFSASNRNIFYSVAKPIIWNDGKKEKGYAKGDSFIRRGTKISPLSAKEAAHIGDSRHKMLSLIDLSLTNVGKIPDIMELVYFFEERVVDASKMFRFLNHDINLWRRFNENFCKYILEWNFDNVKQIDEIDGGVNSLSDGIFFITKELFVLKEKFELYDWSTKIRLEHKEEISANEFQDYEKRVQRINELLKAYIFYQGNYGNNYFFKLTEVEFDKKTLNHFGKSEFAFTMSDDIMKLFLEPLYAMSDPFMVSMREMLQNSFDACKKSKKDKNNMKVTFRYEEEELSNILVEDDGVGMSQDDVIEYFLKVGKSNKINSKEGLIGEFGIGALSIFLIGDKCKVVTKKAGEKRCSFEMEREGFVVRRDDNLFSNESDESSYTKLDITVGQKYKDKSESEIRKILGIDSYIIQDNIELLFECGSNEVKAKRVEPKGRHKEWFYEVGFGKALMYILKPEPEVDKIEKIDKELYDILLKKKMKVLFNNQDGVARYGASELLCTTEMPLIIIEGNIKREEGYIAELSREKYSISDGMLAAIEKEILKISQPNFRQQIKMVNSSTDTLIDKINQINSLSKKYYLNVKNIIFTNKYVEGWEVEGRVRKICVNEISNEQFMGLLDEEHKYVKEGIISRRSSVADVMEEGEPLVISKRFYERFIIKANSSTNGFRRIILLKLLKAIEIQGVSVNDSAQDIWAKINGRKEEIERQLEKYHKNGLIYLNEEGENIVKNIPDLEEYESNLLIVDMDSIH